MNRIDVGLTVFLLALGLLLMGCEQSASSIDAGHVDSIEAGTANVPQGDQREHVITGSRDLGGTIGHAALNKNGHRHQHGSGHAAGPHTHGHRHGVPLYGGRIVAIGHSHHRNGAVHYYAETMPVVGGRITFHVLTVNAEGRPETIHVDATKIVAYVDRLDKEAARPHEVVFSSQGNNGGSTFVVTIPDLFLDCEQLSVVVPKIQLGAERHSFSFTTSKSDESAEPESTAETTEEA